MVNKTKDFEIEITISLQIWKNLKIKFKELGNLSKNDLDQSQIEEYDRLHTYLSDYLLKNYNIRSVVKSTAKTKIGYTVKRGCWRKNCFSCCLFRINIETKECIEICNIKCDHFYNEETGNFET